MSSSHKRLLSLLVCLLLLAGLLPGQSGRTASAGSTLEDLQKERQELQKELDELNEKLANIKDEAERARQKIATYQQRKALVEQQIALLLKSIEIKTQELTEKQIALDEKEQECLETQELFKKRVREIYMNSNASDLAALLSAESFAEFMLGTEALRRVSERDSELINKLDAERKGIAADQAVIEEEMLALSNDQLALDTKYNELAALLQEANEALSAAEAQQEATEEEREKILEEFEKNKKDIEDLMGTGEEEYMGSGRWGWPVPNYSYISSGFGWRTLYGKPNYHTGIDIAGSGIYGKPIKASDAGRVARVVYGTTGYGYYVMLDHGANNWTVYAHMSSIAVKVGQYVVKGETIGYVGSTGNSTGPHLHFEIRLNGVQVNPANYVSYT